MPKKLGLFLAGTKGYSLLAQLAGEHPIDFIVSYRQKKSNAFDDLCKLAAAHKIPVFTREESTQSAFSERLAAAEIVFTAGWQYRLPANLDSLLVFHDSLLPKYRGFSPTVTALICGEKKIGVSLIKPVEAIDAGPIVHQAMLDIEYPARIKDVYEQLALLYGQIAKDVLASRISASRAQDESQATYSIWRDDIDYRIDWNQSAESICRFVNAVGAPYSGARTSLEGREIVLSSIEKLDEELKFAIRQPGKIWEITSKGPVIVCGSGLVRILHATDSESAEAVVFKHLRLRLV